MTSNPASLGEGAGDGGFAGRGQAAGDDEHRRRQRLGVAARQVEVAFRGTTGAPLLRGRDLRRSEKKTFHLAADAGVIRLEEVDDLPDVLVAGDPHVRIDEGIGEITGGPGSPGPSRESRRRARRRPAGSAG